MESMNTYLSQCRRQVRITGSSPRVKAGMISGEMIQLHLGDRDSEWLKFSEPENGECDGRIERVSHASPRRSPLTLQVFQGEEGTVLHIIYEEENRTDRFLLEVK